MSRCLRLPGVYPCQGDSSLLLQAGDEERRRRSGPVEVLELGVGAGVIATHLSGYPDTRVTGVDVSRRALLTTWARARCRGRRVRLHRGDLADPVLGERFDIVVANPPYVPSDAVDPPRRGPTRAWDAGLDGRHVVDRVIDLVPRLLAPGGSLVLVHSALADLDLSRRRLSEHGLAVDEVLRCVQPLGPVLRARADTLRRRGFLAPDQRTEEVAVLRAQARAAGAAVGSSGGAR